jgi:hypothetical protein
MQNRKEDFIELVKTIKEKVHDWWLSYDRKLWTGRIFVYSLLLLLVILVGAVAFTHFNLFHTDVNSARYMLSALVQSQAAIVAIVITLTLIAVQLTASAYSPRVIDIFKKNPDMWILLGCYGVSIFYGFIVLKLVEGAEGEFVSQSTIWSLGSVSISFEFCVSMTYWLGAFTFVALFPYMLNIIRMLKPENNIERLATEITRDKLLKYIEVAKILLIEKSTVDDPIQPIMDLIHGSIMKYDLETTRVGLNAVTAQVIKIICLDEEEEISERFCKHLELVSRLAISKMDEKSTIEVITNLGIFGGSAAEKELKVATLQAAVFLGVVGKATAERGLNNATAGAVMSLEFVEKAAVKKGFDDVAWQAALFLGEVGKAATEKGLEFASKETVWSLCDVGKVAVAEVLKKTKKSAAMSLAELTILSEEIVKTTIHKYKSKLEEQDHDAFKKFMEIYNQEFEKLKLNRTQNKKTESG